jgi:hypothetical protein
MQIFVYVLISGGQLYIEAMQEVNYQMTRRALFNNEVSRWRSAFPGFVPMEREEVIVKVDCYDLGDIILRRYGRGRLQVSELRRSVKDRQMERRHLSLMARLYGLVAI